jgi:POT family proton-dependent oligopeptide transporter
MDNTLNAERFSSSANDSGGIGGQPRGLTTLFFTEMWERFSFYGMRAILLLYMTTELAKGGLGWDPKTAAPIYALYASSVYFLPIIGGWLADRFIGARRATLIGGIIIMIGHFLLAFPPLPFFYAGLVFVATGTGFLKSNISKMVGDLYDKNDERRDGGFSIFYMGINIGALIAPIICGALAVYNWHWGFAAAGVGMALGLVQYFVGRDRLKNVGLPPAPKNVGESSDFSVAYIAEMAGLIIATIIAIYFFGTPLMPSVVVASLVAVVLTGVQDGLSADDWRRLGVIFVLFTFSTLFWMGFEQAATSFNLFAEQLTNRQIPSFLFPVIDGLQSSLGALFGYQNLEPIREFPTAWLQAVNSLFIILLAPVFSLIWVRLGKRQPSDPIKFVFGLFFAGLGFVVVAYAASLTGLGKVSPWWLVLVYLCHTIGELCLSPVGLSSMTKLAPLKMVSLMLGVWFLSISMGNYVAGIIAGEFEPTPDVLVGIFSKVAMILIGGAVILALISPFVGKLISRSPEMIPIEPVGGEV